MALSNADDAFYDAAITVSQDLAQSKAHVLTTDAVLTEVANTFSKVTWRPIAHRIVAALQ